MKKIVTTVSEKAHFLLDLWKGPSQTQKVLLAANLQTRYCPRCEGDISQCCLFLRKAPGPGWADDWFYGRLWSLMGKSAHHRRNEGWRSFVAGTPRLSVPIAGFLSSSNFLQHFLISLEVKVVLPFWGKPFWCFESTHPAIFTFHFLFVADGQVGSPNNTKG